MAEGSPLRKSPGSDGDENHEVKDPRENASTNSLDEDEKSGLDKLRKLFARTLGISSNREDGVDDDHDRVKESSVLSTLSLAGIAEFMTNGTCKNIVVMAGAGISTSAGIPDFRSPGSGLYANLGKYNLPDPMCIFELSYFKKNPRPFFSLAKELLPGNFKPTTCHYFLRLLHEKVGSLLRVYTQNVDGLEQMAGVPPEKIVAAHGTFHTSHCINCSAEYPLVWMKERILADETPTCPECKSYIKPDIVFFGENLPQRFFSLCAQDFKKCDLLIIMGTSLAVQPFASLVDSVSEETPRLLINKEKAGQCDQPLARLLGRGSGLDFDSKRNYRDVAWLGLCDDGCQQLAELLGLGDELRRTVKEEHEKINKEKSDDGPHEKNT